MFTFREGCYEIMDLSGFTNSLNGFISGFGIVDGKRNIFTNGTFVKSRLLGNEREVSAIRLGLNLEDWGIPEKDFALGGIVEPLKKTDYC